MATSRYVKIGEAAEYLGVTPQTLRRWEASGDFHPARRSPGGVRYYDTAELRGIREDAQAPTILYARVSSARQKEDLERQATVLETFGAARGWQSITIKDLGSGLNYRKPGLQEILERILRRKMRRLVITHKDRLLRFGGELLFALCELQGIEVVIINQGEQPSFEEELAQDVIEIITVFCARLYGSRSHKSKKIVDMLSDPEKAKEAAKQLSMLG